APDAPPAGRAQRPPLAWRLLPDRIFYGWYVALACTAMMFVIVGVGYYGLAVFLRPLQQEHGWSSSVVSSATGLYFALSGLAAFAVGPLIDRRGPRPFMTAGIVLTAGGAAALGRIDSLAQLYAVYAVMACAYGMASGVSVNSLLSRWFIQHRAKAQSISSTGVSLGGAVLVPVGTALVNEGGLALAAPALGALVVLVAMPVLWLVVSPEPAELGLVPDGAPRQRPPGARPPRIRFSRANLPTATQYRTWTRAEALGARSFWALLVGFSMALATQTAVLIHQLSFLQGPDKLGSRSAAALAITTTTVGSITARLVVGLFADGFDRRRLAVFFFLAQGSAVFAYVHVHSGAAIYAVALLFGFTIGNVYMMQALLTGEIFGLRSFGSVFGVISLAGQLGSAAGLVFMGWLHDRSGGYTAPFTILAAVNALGALAVSRARAVPAAPTAPAPTPGEAAPS
ncbi:MAG: MFS transporter, partial [Acidimicrobiales bacterium]